jgi:hypothetical protein
VDFLIADTFTDSLGRLTGDEQKAVKTTAFGLHAGDPVRSAPCREQRLTGFIEFRPARLQIAPTGFACVTRPRTPNRRQAWGAGVARPR